MTRYELIAPCHFGLEAVLKKEIIDLGYEIQQVEDGRVTFEGDEEAICRANVFLRTTERIMIKVGKFKAYTFDELFEEDDDDELDVIPIALSVCVPAIPSTVNPFFFWKLFTAETVWLPYIPSTEPL